MKLSPHKFIPSKDKSIWIILAIGLVVGYLFVGDFGISWDEPVHEVYAKQTMLAYRGEMTARGTISNLRYYGPIFSFTAEVSSRFLQLIHPDWGIPEGRHFAYYLTFLVGIYFFYRLARRFATQFAALAGTLLFATQPLLFGHALMNPKDTPFAVFFIITIEMGWMLADALWPGRSAEDDRARNLGSGKQGSIHRVLVTVWPGAERLQLWNLRVWGLILVGGAFLGLTVSIRILGGLAGVIVFLIFIIRGKRQSILPILVYGAIASLATYVVWPFLWGNPVKNLFVAFEIMRKFSWPGRVLYLGERVLPSELPWFYVPKMFAYQLTIPALLLALAGLIIVIFGREFKNSPSRAILLFLWFGIPMAWAVLGDPIFYDNGRQLIFALPPVFLFATLAIDWLWGRFDKRWVGAVVTLALIPSFVGILQLHPYEYVYFNTFAGGIQGAEGYYELDYWCTAGKEAILYVNEVAPEGAIVTYSCKGEQFEPFARPDLRLGDTDDYADPDYLIVGRRVTDPEHPPEGMTLGLRIERGGVRLGEVWVRP
jgi:hypothetical protein